MGRDELAPATQQLERVGSRGELVTNTDRDKLVTRS